MTSWLQSAQLFVVSKQLISICRFYQPTILAQIEKWDLGLPHYPMLHNSACSGRISTPNFEGRARVMSLLDRNAEDVLSHRREPAVELEEDTLQLLLELSAVRIRFCKIHSSWRKSFAVECHHWK